ncbi:hypothetical protein BO70DRAFT_413827 [Aspergillus heteromorphus CBS 117.55]|uniref:Rhodopsin domain-containing protein n=1 Tax=Aspergillus heteromorphus CBS 117.55 TaxID=1448321 RepID=A0A317VIQ7_9EURO|nr:uncharacterized protein BO70DRAFT_413827 [Aspergillus heteromorphus CBS 117.55]PWY73067.1 hypothetical protein BO70DRAFT_413827 [Aspergillus heteromorphus CBS 117.55]
MVHDSRQNTALALVVVFPVLAGVAILMRAWSRSLTGSKLGSDIKVNYIGIHTWDIPADYDEKQGLIWNYANQLVYNPCLTMIKLSVLLFLRRLESQSVVVNRLIWFTIAVTIALFLAVIGADVFQCHPVAYVYDMSIPSGTCINQGAFYVASAVTNLVTDLMVMSIPVLIMRSLQMPVKRKIAICVVLSFGGITTGAGVWRLALLIQAFYPSHPVHDASYSIGFCSSAMEVNVAVVAACAPCFKAIASTYLPRLWGTSQRSEYTSTPSKHPTTPSSARFGRPRLMSDPRAEDDTFELAGPYIRRSAVDPAAMEREMRKYYHYAGAERASLSSEDGVEGLGAGSVLERYAAESRTDVDREEIEDRVDWLV